MNRLYIVGSIIIGIGVLCIYHAGIQDAKKEDTWTKATHADDSEMGIVADVRFQPHGVGTTGDTA